MTHHLMGAAELAERLGVSRQRAHQISARESFPAPVADLASGKVWETAAVEAWIADHRPDRAAAGSPGQPVRPPEQPEDDLP